MTDESEILYRLHAENLTQARHHETMRANVTNYIIAIAAGLSGIVALDHKLNAQDLPLTVFMMLLGFFGALLVLKHYERVELHSERARRFRDAIEKLVPETNISNHLKAANGAQKTRWRWFHDLRLYHLWVGIQCCVMLFGGVLCWLAYSRPMGD